MTKLGSIAAGLFCLLAACDSASPTDSFSGLALKVGPHLLLDDHLIERASGVQRVVNAPSRRNDIPNPLITAAGDGSSTPYFAVLREGGAFRLWYNTPLDTLGSDASLLAYLESADGITWRRPRRILSTPGGIRFGASVIRRPGGDYALGYYQDGGLRVATSQSGLDWTLLSPREVIAHNHDIAGITYDPVRQQYIGIVSNFGVREVGGLKLDLRSTRQSVSKDLLTWEKPWKFWLPMPGMGCIPSFTDWMASSPAEICWSEW